MIADSRIDIECARHLIKQTCEAVESKGYKEARVEMSVMKAFVPQALGRVLDRAIQVHGAMGVSDLTPLAFWLRHERCSRLYDGPDEVHKSLVAREMLKGYGVEVSICYAYCFGLIVDQRNTQHATRFTTMQALQGIRVLDLSRVLAAPYCTQLLGDYGAEIIKVEQPGSGDGTRQWGPPFVGEQSAYFLSVNRNKQSVTMDFKTEVGASLIKELAAHCDVLIENFLPGTLARVGLDYDTLRELHPGLIYCSVTGYGQTGPYKDRPGYDFVIQAQGGLMSITGEPGGEPMKVGVAIADITTGLFAANAILAALHHRQKTGRGQYIDVALLDSQVAWLANVAHNYLAGEVPVRYGNAHASIVPYQTFATSDSFIAIAVGSDAQYQRLCACAGCMALWDDERFRTNPGRVRHRD